MLEAPQGARLVSYEAVVTRGDSGVHGAPGTVERGLIDHSHPWLFTEKELRALALAENQFELLLARARAHLPGAVIIPAGSASIAGGKQVFEQDVSGTTALPPKYIAFGQGDPAGTRITAVTSMLGLAGEIAAPGGTNTNTGQSARVTGTVSDVTTTNLSDTVQVVGTLTAGVALAITEAGLATTSPFPAQTTVATITSTFLAGATTAGGNATLASATGWPSGSQINIQMVSTGGTAVEVFQATPTGTALAANARGVNGTSAAAARAAGVLLTNVTPGGTGGCGLFAAIGDFAVINLATNDTLQLTAKTQFT